jgi:hypothetical protein
VSEPICPACHEPADGPYLVEENGQTYHAGCYYDDEVPAEDA